jgi:penicillin-insensitive murein DD-endopeptidase
MRIAGIIGLIYLVICSPACYRGSGSVHHRIMVNTSSGELAKKPLTSTSKGTVGKGSLVNGVKVPHDYRNFSYFSNLSYYILGRCYVNAKVYNALLDTYETLEKKYPVERFMVMECSQKHGGKMVPHFTHQNGLSVDFMTPLKDKTGKQTTKYDHLGESHYNLDFDENGVLTKDKNVSIDFNVMAAHILAVDDAAKKNGLKISKVILKLNLKDNLFATKGGKEILRRKIYFAMKLTKKVNEVHDDHYHVDFEETD